MATMPSLLDNALDDGRHRGEGVIVVQTLADRIFAIVRERIIAGAIPPDRPIRQDALAAELGVSKIPLREAMARLEQEGLLHGVANRGYMIGALSVEQAEDIYGLRLKIEPMAAASAALVADDEDRAKLVAAFEALDPVPSKELSSLVICNGKSA